MSIIQFDRDSVSRILSDATTEEKKVELAKSGHWIVRSQLARENIPSSIQEILKTSGDSRIVYPLAENERTLPSIQKYVFDNYKISDNPENWIVMRSLARNKNLSKDLQLPLALLGNDSVGTVIAGRNDLDLDALELLSKNPCPIIRRVIMENNSIPQGYKESLMPKIPLRGRLVP